MLLRVSFMSIFVVAFAYAADARPAVWPIAYRLDAPAQVSLGIYDGKGRQVRTLLYGVPQSAGAHSLSWDGVDRAGAPVLPGEYRWKLLATPGFQATYLTTIGTNPGTASHDPWFGNHGGPQVVALTGSGIVVGGSGENTASYLCTSLDGKLIPWRTGQHLVAAWPASIAGNTETFVDLACAIWDGKQQARVFIMDAKTGTERSPSFDVQATGDTTLTYRMDANTDEIVVSYAMQNEVRWYDYKGALKHARPLPAPGDLGIDASGTSYVLSEGQVIQVGKDGDPRVLIAKKDLTEPLRLAIDRNSGKLWIAEAGAGQQIKRFTLDGKLEKAYGRAGGRAYGDYQGRDFRSITDLCPDGAGGVLVTEGANSLCRLVRIGSSGEVLREWFGPQQFYNYTHLDPLHPDEAWFYGGYDDAAVAKIDWKTGAWNVIRTFHYPTGDGLFPMPGTSTQGRYVPRSVGGKSFLVWEGNDGPVVLRVDAAAGRLIPVAAARVKVNGAGPKAWQEAVQRAGIAPGAAGSFTWTDTNGDGDFQAEEFSIGGSIAQPSFWSQTAMRADGGVILPTAGEVPWNELANLGTAELPRWDLTQLHQASARYPADMRHFLGGVNPMGSYVDQAKNMYALVVGNCAANSDRHGGGWPMDYQGTSRFVKWAQDGTVQWSVGHQLVPHEADDPVATTIRSEFSRPVRIVAEVKDCLVVAEQVYRPATVWTTDGLYAGNFLDRRADDGLPGQYYHWWQDPVTRIDGPIPYDCLHGGSVSTLADGRIVWMPMGAQNTPVYAIGGWDGWVRKEGMLTVATEAAPIPAGTGLKAMYYASSDLSGEPVSIATDARLWFAADVEPESQARSWQKTPIPGLVAGADFSARWTGYLRAPYSEEYRLRVGSDAGSRYRVWCDGALLCDTWDASGSPEVSTSVVIHLQAGRYYPLEVEYAHHGADPRFSLFWDSPTLDRQRIPTEFLYAYDGRSGTGLRADYLGKSDSVFTCRDPGIIFDPRNTGATGVRWTGYLLPKHLTSEESCTLSVEGAGAVRLLIDDRVILDTAQLAGTAEANPVQLRAGIPARLRLEYTGNGKPELRLLWNGELVPQRQMLPATIPTGRGVTVEYFSDTALTTLVGVNEIPTADLRWEGARVASFPGQDIGGVAVHGTLTPLHASGLCRYLLHIQATGGAELLWDGKSVTLKDDPQGATVAVDLLAGHAIPLTVRYHATGGQPSLRLLWSAQDMPETLVPTAALQPLPSPQSEDPFAGLPLSGGLSTWRTTIIGEAPSQWRTEVSRQGMVPVAFLSLGSKGDVSVEKTVHADGKPLTSWCFTTGLSYPGIYPNHGGEGQFLSILDQQGRTIVQLSPQQVAWPADEQLVFNGKTLCSLSMDELKKITDVQRELRILVRNGQATVTLAGLPSLTTGLADPTADWTRPARIQLRFTQANAVYERPIRLAGPRFFGSRAAK